MFFKLLSLITGQPSETRSAKWPAVRAEHLKQHGECEACGGKDGLNVHHKRPYHLYPELELEPSNLLTLCERNGCHFLLGHGRDWKAFNPDVMADTKMIRSMIRGRRYTRP